MQTFAPKFKEIHAVLISQVIFDRSEWVSLWGYVDNGKEKIKMDFVTDFETLNKLLRLSGKTGDDIQMQLVEKMEGEWQEPMVVDLENIYGKPLLMDQCRLKVYHPREQDVKGGWTEDKQCLFIDEVIPLLEKRTITRIRKDLCRDNLAQCMQLLAASYSLYLGYLELDVAEAAARQKAELEDELKFKMAYYAWKGEGY